MFFGACLRSYQLARALGGGDENQYLLDYGDASLKYIATTYFFGGHPVFHTLLMRLMIMVFGDENAIAVRLPAFLSGIACLWLIYRVALQLFDSLFIARLSLLLAAICPVHIYYSQVARGYSLIMFFSVAMVYATLKLLDAPEKAGWGAILVLCGVLSVYTVPTNVYFIVALAGWLFMALLTPRYAGEIKTASSGKAAFFFLSLFLLMALLSYLVYLPLVDQVIAESKNYHLAHEYETSKLVIAGRVPAQTLSLIFPGGLVWFLPLLATGALFGNTVRRSYRLLPFCVFLLPLLVPLLTGVSGYPRNYLYNLPLLIIFLAAGIAKAGQIVNRRGVGMGIAVVYTLVSLKVVFLEHYPSIQMPDGKLYQRMIREHSNPLDLIAIADPKDYLYAKSVFQQNLRNAVLLNKITGVKLIALDSTHVDTLVLPDGHALFPVFKGISNDLEFQDVTRGKKMFSLSKGEAVSLLPEDFEVNSNWLVVSGAGRISKDSERKLTGTQSLILEGSEKDVFVIEAVLPKKILIQKESLVVFLWSGKVLGGVEKKSIFIPALVFGEEGKAVRQLRQGKVNDGIRTKVQPPSANGIRAEWPVDAFIGRLPPGEYTLAIQLLSLPNQVVSYDGFRLFVMEIASAKE